MKPNELPKMNMDKAETGCCPKFDPALWDGKEFRFENKLFVMGKTINIFHMPMNINSMYKKICGKIEEEGADPKDHYLVLSSDPSPWKGEHLFAVAKEIPGEEMVNLTATCLSKVYEGAYKEVGKWLKEITQYVADQGKEAKKIYFFYTTCPKCAKHYGKNYVVGLAEV